MYIHSIKLVNYKSLGDYKENEIIIEPDVTTIIGKNESGKSNILEGISKIQFFKCNPNAFLSTNVNRRVIDNTLNTFEIVFKPSSEERKNGFDIDGKMIISKEKNIISEGLINYYKSWIKSELIEFKNLLISISTNPFKFQNSDLSNYLNFLKEIEKDEIDLYLLNTGVQSIFSRDLSVLGTKKEDIELIVNKLKDKWTIFKNSFPIIFYRNQNKVLNSSYKLEDIQKELNGSVNNSLLKELVDIIGYDKENFIYASKSGVEPKQLSYREQIKKLINKTINKKFQDFYTTEQLSLQIEFNSGIIAFTVHSEDGDAFALSERSNGLKWYLNLFIDMLANDISKNVVFLMDEPGVNLHVNAQKELLNLFDDLANHNNQIVYTTHSPYMLNTEKLHKIRAVVKNDELSLVYKTAYDTKISTSSQNDTLAPIIQALGMNLNDTFGPSKDKLNIVCEGVSDYLFLMTFAKNLNVDKDKYNFIPTLGVTNCINICMILHGWGCKYIALFDYDKEGVESGGEIMKKTFDATLGNDFYYVIDIIQNDIDNRTYNDKKYKKTIEDIVGGDELDNYCQTMGYGKFGKALIAKLFNKDVENGNYSLNQKSIENFKELFIRMKIL